MFKGWFKKFQVSITLLFLLSFVRVDAQQINISRVEQMSNLPVPYEMRDWKNVTVGYDSLVFDLSRTGQYLPLIWLNSNTINYPEHNSFGLHTVVGTTSPLSSENINLLPATIGASLVGIDKSNQNGYNWVLMCEEYFNKENNANVYLNHPNGSNWDDWWYDVMPNVFFYQLYDLYPGIGSFSTQFSSVADRWLSAVDTLGGSTTPWIVPNMNYRAFNLMTMVPFNSGVEEPEAAGALAWILYNAYIETGDEKYRIGSEWCMEFLNSLVTNPSYELQLSYGVYAAARMNAELGTNYDVSKIINWCFNVGPLREWGAILGTWGGYDVDGLIGEVNGTNDYAFLMNTFEQAGALVPLVRYDDRFARTIGKWILNASNASRLFYTNYLPNNNQDSEEWSHLYDPNSYIGHEALRQTQYGMSPYATGDAISGGWGMTNLALYGSSHVGIFGGIIDTTNIPAILKLDLLKTDYFHKDSYPSFLYYNPYQSDKSVVINVGNESSDIYDAVSNTIIKSSVTGETSIIVPADQAIIAVIIPAGSVINYDLEKALANGIVIDFNSGQSVNNHSPRIKSLSSEKQTIIIGDSIKIFCTAVDIDNDPISYNWYFSSGNLAGAGSIVNWTAPSDTGDVLIKCIIDDGEGGITSDSIIIKVSEYINTAPLITGIMAQPRKIHLGSNSTITCSASDADGDELSFDWFSEFGSISGSGPSIIWLAPIISGNYYILCHVSDGNGGIASDSIRVSVRDTSINQSGEMVAFYPFNGNANDISGFNNNGTVSGAVLVSDRWGNPASAYLFDGVNDNISIASSSSLNFQNSITINFWIKVGEFYERESYPLSHGNWENRWKISITNKRLRWTLKSNTGIKDLDSETELVINTLYNVTVLYNGSDFEIYINGNLDAFTEFSGSILTTPISLMIGQVLPGNTQYNFKGVLDDIRIYNYALSYNNIQSLYDFVNNVEDELDNQTPQQFNLVQNYPNPFNSQTKIKFEIPISSKIRVDIFNILGQKVRTLLNDQKEPGYYSINWNGQNDFGEAVNSGIYLLKLSSELYSSAMKMVLLK